MRGHVFERSAATLASETSPFERFGVDGETDSACGVMLGAAARLPSSQLVLP